MIFLKKFAFLICVSFMFCICVQSNAFSKDLFKLDTAWMPEHESFAMWYAIQKGWDEEAGLDIQMHYFDSGMAELEALPGGTWVLGGIGGVPHLWGALRYDTYLIGLGNNESYCNNVLARADNPIFKNKGSNPKYPNVFGTKDLVKGKTFLVTKISSSHFAMSSYLDVLGLKDQDIVSKNMDQSQALAAFNKGIGDYVALWAPYTFIGLQKYGWKEAGNLATCGRSLIISLIGDKEFCDNHPEIVAKFLRVYFRAMHMVKEEGVKLLPQYRKFYMEWAGRPMKKSIAKSDLLRHKIWSYDQQVKLLKGGQNSEVAKWEFQVANFFQKQGKLSEKEVNEIKNKKWVTDKFLNMVKLPIPGYDKNHLALD